MRTIWIWALGLLAGAHAAPALAQPGMGPWLDEALPAVEGEPLQMLKACPDQSLSGGVQLKERADLYRVMSPDAALGRPEMIELVTRTAEEMVLLKPVPYTQLTLPTILRVRFLVFVGSVLQHHPLANYFSTLKCCAQNA